MPSSSVTHGSSRPTSARHCWPAESVVAPARDRHLLRHRILQENADPRLEDHLGALASKSTMLREVIAERLGTSTSDPRVQLLGGTTSTIMDVAYTLGRLLTRA
jgi:hypothetical protein